MVIGDRFNYGKFDEATVRNLNTFKKMFMDIEAYASAQLPHGRSKALVMTKLEETYMWVGKGLRDRMDVKVEQLERAGL